MNSLRVTRFLLGVINCHCAVSRGTSCKRHRVAEGASFEDRESEGGKHKLHLTGNRKLLLVCMCGNHRCIRVQAVFLVSRQSTTASGSFYQLPSGLIVKSAVPVRIIPLF